MRAGHLTNLVQLAYLAVVRTHDSSLQSTHKSKRGPYGRHYDEGPDAGSAASAGTPNGPDLQRRAVTRVRVACTRGRDNRLAAAGGHLRRARRHPPGGGSTWSEARGREDLGRGQPADDHGHKGAGGRGEGREGPSLRADLWRLRADVQAVGLDRSQKDQGDLRPRHADDHAAEGEDGQSAFDRGGSHAAEGGGTYAAEGVERLTGSVRRRRVEGISPSFSPGEATC